MDYNDANNANRKSTTAMSFALTLATALILQHPSARF
jgi:hypothetical protein